MPSGRNIPPGASTEPGFGYKLPDLDSGKGAFLNLVDYCAHTIFHVTAVHEVVGSVIEYFSTPAGLTTKMYDESYQDYGKTTNKLDDCGQVMADVQTFIQSISVICFTGYRQPPLIFDWSNFLQIRDKDAIAWSRFNLTEEQADNVRDYLSHMFEIVLDRDPYQVQGYTGLAANLSGRGQDDADPIHRCEASRAKVEERIRGLRHGTTCAVQYHNDLVQELHYAFMLYLLRLSVEVENRNKERNIPYQAMNPVNMESSVSI